MRPISTSCAEMSCVMSTICDEGAAARRTPFISPTYPSAVPKSVGSVMNFMFHPLGDGGQRRCRRRLQLGDHDRLTAVRSFHDARIERYLPQQRKSQLLGQALAPTGSEQRRRLATVRALEPAHVLDDC